MRLKNALAIVAVSTIVISLGSTNIFAKEFSDISGHWAKSTIEKWSDKNIISGYPDGRFGPNDAMTRGQFAVVIDKIMKYKEMAKNEFLDLKSGMYYTIPILKLYENGIIAGNGDGTVSPDANISREQAIVLLCKSLDIPPSSTFITTDFKDDDKISSWSKGYIRAAVNRGLVKGNDEGYFNPLNNVTRAEGMSMINNAIDMIIDTPGTYENLDVRNGGVVLINTTGVHFKNSHMDKIIVSIGAGKGDRETPLDDMNIDNISTYSIEVLGTKKLNISNSTISSIDIHNNALFTELNLSSNNKDISIVSSSAGVSKLNIDSNVSTVNLDGPAITLKGNGYADFVSITSSAQVEGMKFKSVRVDTLGKVTLVNGSLLSNGMYINYGGAQKAVVYNMGKNMAGIIPSGETNLGTAENFNYSEVYRRLNIQIDTTKNYSADITIPSSVLENNQDLFKTLIKPNNNNNAFITLELTAPSNAVAFRQGDIETILDSPKIMLNTNSEIVENGKVLKNILLAYRNIDKWLFYDERQSIPQDTTIQWLDSNGSIISTNVVTYNIHK